jgi:hypothetical protein
LDGGSTLDQLSKLLKSQVICGRWHGSNFHLMHADTESPPPNGMCLQILYLKRAWRRYHTCSAKPPMPAWWAKCVTDYHPYTGRHPCRAQLFVHANWLPPVTRSRQLLAGAGGRVQTRVPWPEWHCRLGL